MAPEEDPKENASEEDPESGDYDTPEEEPGDGEKEKGKGRLSKDFKERWERLDRSNSEGPDDEEEEDDGERKPGLGLFKRKMEERKGEKPALSFLAPGISTDDTGSDGTDEEEDGPPKEEMEDEGQDIPAVPDGDEPGTGEDVDGPEGEPPSEKMDVLDSIIHEVKGKKKEFIRKRKAELEKEAERPELETEPFLSKLRVLKDRMEKKGREESKPDLFGVGFTPEVRKSRETEVERDEEEIKKAFKASMEKTIREGSITRHLSEVLSHSMDVVEDETERARKGLLRELRELDAKGFEGSVRKIVSKVRGDRVFQAENDLVNLKIAIEARKARERLKKEREERLEAHLENLEEKGADLEDVVDRHMRAIEMEMDQTRARVTRDLRKRDFSGYEHVVRNIEDMLEDHVFDAEEQLLELKLALKARQHRDDLKRTREERIHKRARESLPSQLGVEEEGEKRPGLDDLAEGTPELEELVEEVEVPGIEELTEEVPELVELIEGEEPPEEAMMPSEDMEPSIEDLDELGPGEAEADELDEPEVELDEAQCGICGTLLEPGQRKCPACGTLFYSETPADDHLMAGDLPELTEIEDVQGIVELEPLSLEEVTEEEMEPPEISEIQCGICGSMVPSDMGRCHACGTILFETGEVPSLEPVEGEGEHPLLTPVEEIPCPECGEPTPSDTGICETCGASLVGVPVLEPVEPEGLPELVPVGPWEEVTSEVDMEEIGVPVVDMTEDMLVTEEVELETVREEHLEPVEAEAWTEYPEDLETEMEWRRLVIRGKRLFEEGRVKEALEAYDDSIEVSPSMEAYLGKGQALMTLGWHNSALDCMNKAIEIDGESVPCWMFKARVEEELGKYSEATISLDRVLDIEPQNADALRRKGEMLMQMGKVREAVEVLDTWVEVSPSEDTLSEVVDLSKKVLSEIEAEELSEMEEVEEMEEVSAAELAEELSEMEEEELRARKKPRVKARTLARSKGLTNGLSLVNGRGLTNGKSLVNGRVSLVNGRRTSLVNGKKGAVNGTRKGLINGRGLVNGASGLVNGRAMPDREDTPVVRFRRGRRRLAAQALGIVLIIVIVALIPFAYNYLNPPQEGIVVDGQFSDWGEATIYDDRVADQPYNRDVDIVQYSMLIDDTSLSYMVRVEGGNTMMNGADMGVDVLHIFIETDGSAGTGYSIMGLGADYMLEIVGWDGKVHTSRLHSFNTSSQRSQQDWNGWLPGPSVKSISKGTGLEVQVPRAELASHTSENIEVLVHMSDNGGHEDYSDHIIAKGKGVIGTEYDHINPPNLQPDTADNPILRLNITAHEAIMDVTSITVHRTGHLQNSLGVGDVKLWGGRTVTDDFNPSSAVELARGRFGGRAGTDAVELTPETPIQVLPDSTVSLFVTADLLDNVQLHGTFGLDLERSDIDVVEGGVTLTKTRVHNSYIGTAPTTITIDGAFRDWEGVPSWSDTYGDARSLEGFEVPRIDMREYRSHFDDSHVSFYLRTTGSIMKGMVIPAGQKVRPEPKDNVTPPGPTPGPPELPVVTGADMAIIYLDTDQNSSSGLTTPGFPLGAEHKMVIEGKSGKVISTKLFEYTGPGSDGEIWEEEPIIVPAANGLYRLETQVSRNALNIGEHARVDAFFVMTDWEGNPDVADEVLPGSRGVLSTISRDVIPDSVTPGDADVPLMGLELEASEDIILHGLTFERLGNATDLATGSVNIYEDNGDSVFTALDTGTSLAASQFENGVAEFIIVPSVKVQAGTSLLLFLASDITYADEDRTIGVSLERDSISSTAGRVSGNFPMTTYISTIGSGSDRSNNMSINFTDGAIDKNWSNIGRNSEGYTWDGWGWERRFLPKGGDIMEVEVTDDGSWMSFHVTTGGQLNSSVHMYLDTNKDSSADYDLVYDFANNTVILYQNVGGNWTQVNLTTADRSDQSKKELEFGIEFSYLNLSANQTINYVATTETDNVPGGGFIDSGPGFFGLWWWSQNYTTIPEFSDLIIPIIGMFVIFIVIRRRRHGSNRTRARAGPGQRSGPTGARVIRYRGNM